MITNKPIKYFRFVYFLFFLLTGTGIRAQERADDPSQIRLNQIGFYPDAAKTAVVLAKGSGEFAICKADGKVVFKGRLEKSVKPAFSGQFTWLANFSSFKQPGSYYLQVPGAGKSYPFKIAQNVLEGVADGSLKAFYFMRASLPLKEKYAGKWHRAEGHPDTTVFIHASAASDKRPEGSVISSPRGWYDAGDYNKYIVNSGISTSTLLSLYEDFPSYMKMVNLHIPESGNHLPDVLNEVLWNIRWMLTMQDPNDGGVYHKLTNAAFDKFEMPDQAVEKRYVVQKSTAATLDFAAVMAQSYRIWSEYKKQLPGLADSCLAASQSAWAWAQQHPDVLYNQNEMNKTYSPAITTGDYGDRNVTDELMWAASELTIATGNDEYIRNVNILPDTLIPLPNWAQVKLLAYYDLVKHGGGLKGETAKYLPVIKTRLLKFADGLMAGADETAYQTVITKSVRNFGWGSNSTAANHGIALIQAFKLTGERKYLTKALDNLDYLLGRNASGYCYVTGFGSKPTMHPHHRPSVADGIADPVPGLLAGGPNPGMQDHIKVPSLVPDEAYIDDDRAYAANEIAINWNAPLAYLANALQALQDKL
jgi:endoglucanase